MVAVGVLSSLGLWALGIDAPFALGLTGAVLTFIPNVGSIVSALPGMLIGFLQAPLKAVAVGLVFWFVHLIEGTFITPYVDDETVDVPPVLSLFSTVVFGVLFGPVGVILTGPLTVVAIELVERLYVEDVLGEPPSQPAGTRRRSWLRRVVAGASMAKEAGRRTVAQQVAGDAAKQQLLQSTAAIGSADDQVRSDIARGLHDRPAGGAGTSVNLSPLRVDAVAGEKSDDVGQLGRRRFLADADDDDTLGMGEQGQRR
jgi:hypothetical protein